MENWREKPLFKLTGNPKDFWTVDDAMKGTSILGGTGSGKTSGSGKTIAKQFLKNGWGGLVLCAKNDEADLWRQYCKEAGRESDLIIFGKGSVHKSGNHQNKKIVFNPLHYEMTRMGKGAKDAFNITNVFLNIYRMGNRIANDGDSKDSRFWETALRRVLSRTIELINLAGEELTFKNITDLIYYSPTEAVPYDNDQMIEMVQKMRDKREIDPDDNYFLSCLALAFLATEDEDITTAKYMSFDSAFKYFTNTLPTMSDKTRSTIIETFMGLIEPFLGGILFEHFTESTNLYPEQAYTENKIIVLDFPVKEYLESGILAQSIFKLIFQQAVERRDTNKYPIPVFIWADEAQYFINPYDQIFLTTARSSRAATVYLSQNISNYLAAIGGEKPESRVNSLLGNMATKIFHANSDAVTNEYASKLIGETLTILGNKNFATQLFSLNFNSSKGMTTTMLPQVQPKEFTTFKSGGAANNFEVEAIVLVTGKEWSNNTNFMRTIFEQQF